MNYSNQLKSILKASGWSQEELASRLSVSFVTLNAWVNARSKPRQKATDNIKALYFQVLGADSLDVAVLQERMKKVGELKTTTNKIINDKDILNTLILHLTFNTNTIEGSTMTLDDTERVLFNHEVLSNRTQIEQAEARNHEAALLWLLSELQRKNFEFNEDIIKQLHLRLMNGIIGDAGQYRRHSVRILGSRVTVANSLKIPELMNQLINEVSQPSEDPIARLSTTHAVFEKIHPFSDGNGRVGRLLMLAQALTYELVPPLIPKERKYAYYKYLELAQMKDDMKPLQFFIAESIIGANDLLFSNK
jgi:Fic family protein/DNA-binding XRE family transcriptional regulator